MKCVSMQRGKSVVKTSFAISLSSETYFQWCGEKYVSIRLLNPKHMFINLYDSFQSFYGHYLCTILSASQYFIIFCSRLCSMRPLSSLSQCTDEGEICWQHMTLRSNLYVFQMLFIHNLSFKPIF
jgi:hypothetical protein